MREHGECSLSSEWKVYTMYNEKRGVCLRYWNASASAGLLRMLRMQKSSRYDMDFGCCAW